MWHIARYQPVTLFSLRPANATTAGGKTLLGPTPFAVKMALLNAAITVYGQDGADAWFDFLRDLEVAIRLPEALLVIATFQRILRPKEGDNFGTGLTGSWQSNIAFREYVHFGGELALALCAPGGEEDVDWPRLLSQISYLGKRGSFMQFTGYRQANSPDGFTLLNPASSGGIDLNGTLQLMDDCGPEMTFEHANVYSSKRLTINTPDGRVLNTVVLPYEIARSARGFTSYRRIQGGN
ncbi:MAG: hypothetical protein JXB07_01940 [Anaerolineae bacterium]|nr:hypothetical protein [Anaerolineae bacterium]